MSSPSRVHFSLPQSEALGTIAFGWLTALIEQGSCTYRTVSVEGVVCVCVCVCVEGAGIVL